MIDDLNLAIVYPLWDTLAEPEWGPRRRPTVFRGFDTPLRPHDDGPPGSLVLECGRQDDQLDYPILGILDNGTALGNLGCRLFYGHPIGSWRQLQLADIDVLVRNQLNLRANLSEQRPREQNNNIA